MAGQRTPATTVLDRASAEYRLHPYRVDVRAHTTRARSYGDEAADALGVAPQRVFKTLVADVAGRLVVGVVPVSGSLDLRALAAATGEKKAAMADPAAAQRATGYVTGGISPLGHRQRLTVVVDSSALDFDTVFCSAGRRGLQLELSPGVLVTVAGASVAAISSH